jgi:DNA-binding NarL/FixJ family response regulator
MKSSTITAEVAMQHKILILDDHPLVRSGIRVSLEETFPDCEVWEASTVAEAISITAEQSPTVAVIDLRLQDESGLQYAEYVSREEKDIPCVVLTSFSSPQSILAAFDTGAVNAFLEKSLDIEPLAAAIDAASKGFSSLTLSVAREAARNIQSEGGYNPAEFTERENAIAQLVADGHSDTAIAEELNIASSTIRNHLTSIYRKLDVESRTQLASRVWRQRASSPGHTPSNEN